jgi:hypothetical protein
MLEALANISWLTVGQLEKVASANANAATANRIRVFV